MRTATIIVMILWALKPGVSAGGDLVVLSPPNHGSISSDHVYLVGRTTAPLVEISLNGETIGAVIPKDSIFHTLLWFGYGLNDITVTPVYADPARQDQPGVSIEILCGPEVSGKYERLFKPFIFHTDESKQECIGCHDNAGNSPDMIGSDDACQQCHRVIRERFKKHIPDDNKACINCHHVGHDLSLLATGTYFDQNPCFSCHQDKISQFSQEFIHGPVAGGSCVICHDPHGSKFKKSLRSPEAILCLSCHTELEETMALRVKHKPFENGQCVTCHNPHSTNNKWVLVKKSQDVCIRCHEELGTLKSHNHPYNIKPRKPLVKPLELTDSGTLECISCHNPHATNSEHLLRITETNTCEGCHRDKS